MTDIRMSIPSSPAGFAAKPLMLVALAVALGGVAFFVPMPLVSLVLISAAVVLLLVSVPLAGMTIWHGMGDARIDDHLASVHSEDAAATFTTDAYGQLVWRNPAAEALFGQAEAVSIAEALRGSAALPNSLLQRLTRETIEQGHASESLEIDAHPYDLRLHLAGSARLLWRFVRRMPSAGGETGPEALQLRIDAEGAIVWMSPALLELVDHPPRHIDGLLERPPLKPNAPQMLEFHDHSALYWIAVRPAGEGLREICLCRVPQEREDMQFDWIPVPLLEIDEDGMVSKANRLARQLLSLDPGESVALHHLFEGLGREVGDWLADGFEGRAQGRPEVMRASRAETDLYIQVTLERVRDGVESRMMAVLHDATEMKRLEAQFVQSQKMQAIGQLAGGVAHDFNNLLTAISGHCDLLLLRHDPGDQDFADLEQINQNANRAAALVGQLLAFSRKQNLRPEMLDLRDILADLTHLLNRLVGERVRLSFDHDADLKMVRADRRQLEQVIVNLVVNARDAMPDGGDVRVVTRTTTLAVPEPHDRVEVPAGRYALIEVIDEGTGIPEDRITKIFEPFFTTKKAGEGTGLGLSTAYGIVKQTGGYIFAKSVLGQGTTFSIYLPASDQPAVRRAVPDKRVETQKPQAEGCVLLVEDEAPVRAFASRALAMRGYEVLEASDAESALEICRDKTARIDAFVTDVIMPGRDGPSWVREALETRPDTRVIFMSGYAEESFADAQRQIPNSTFLPKPFSLADLTATVDAQFQRE
ncbi:ATP-binding protein [Palleronia sp. LCG004]|uniref:hybrid sensor histidine kinase/response regulator n=1 Tax=Palleronia sp. LCG004 TaxID=3079304 RepID=UPI002942143A|nr:ATP-binding protein [Palleronia sp. LCG004]WOI57248.1 ATP-binding protein [Palleronia sp. LCG004]